MSSHHLYLVTVVHEIYVMAENEHGAIELAEDLVKHDFIEASSSDADLIRHQPHELSNGHDEDEFPYHTDGDLESGRTLGEVIADLPIRPHPKQLSLLSTEEKK